ncbi:MAG: FKBP-type peptidyl-prolyl cis-trans isomerase SlyD [Fluviibacter phosphoraccumulans EoVTN8]
MQENKPQIQADSLLTLHYRLITQDGEDVVSTFDLGPATIQMGNGELNENLEACLVGLVSGGHAVFEVPAEAGFGQHNPALVQRIARTALPVDQDLKENTLIEFASPEGAEFAGFVREVDATHVLMDFNHPLAGKSLRFEVQIIGLL